MLLTLSTCWYSIRSKFPSNQYLLWIRNLLSIVNNFNLVIYSDAKSLKIILPVILQFKRNLNIKIKIIIKPIEEFYGFKYKDNWLQNHNLKDIDLHKRVDWELIMLWCEKVHFVNETITNKYFETPYYGWCDIGYFRNNPNNIHTRNLVNWPNLSNIFNDELIHYGCVQNNPVIFKTLLGSIQNHYQKNNNNIEFAHKEDDICFAGGFFIIKPNKIQQYVKIFDDKLKYYFDNKYFIKDDQTILMDCIFTNMELFKLHFQDDDRYDNWFMFQIHLNHLL